MKRISLLTILMVAAVYSMAATTMHDTITLANTKVTTTSYTDWTCNGASGTAYKGNCAKDQNTNAMQFTSKAAKLSGVVNTTSKGYLREVRIAWSKNCQDRTLNIYGSNTAYSLSDLQAEGKQSQVVGTIAKGTSSLGITGNYPYIGVRVASGGAALIDTIILVWDSVRHEEEDVPLTAVRLDQDSLTIEAESTAKLTVTYEPDSATNKGVTWVSSNSAIATVLDGTVTGVAAGEVMIIATSTDGQQLADTCYVTIKKKDIWRGRDVYYKIRSLSELHHNDSVIFVNETNNRASAAFETYTYKKRDDKQQLIEYTAGRIAAAELEIVRDGDSIGCWGVDEVRMAKTTQGWQIYVIVEEEDPYEQGAYIGVEKLLRANEMNKIMVEGEGNQYWDITFAANGDAVVTSKDAKAGTIQFNTNNKTFTTYTSTQAPIQIYRKKDQTIEPTALEDNRASCIDNHKLLHNGQFIIVRDGKAYDVMGRSVQSR